MSSLMAKTSHVLALRGEPETPATVELPHSVCHDFGSVTWKTVEKEEEQKDMIDLHAVEILFRVMTGLMTDSREMVEITALERLCFLFLEWNDFRLSKLTKEADMVWYRLSQ